MKEKKMISAFGVDHGDIEKGLLSGTANFGRRLVGGGKKMLSGGGKHTAVPGGGNTPIYDQLSAKYGMNKPAAPGGARKAGAHKGAYRPKSFLPGGGGGARRA